MAGLDIPEGTKIGKPMKGGDNTLRIVLDLLSKKTFNGYVMIKLEKEEENVTSYLIVKDSKPKLGIREVLKRRKKDPNKFIRKVYAGENTLEDVKTDSQDEAATIEVYSGIDIEPIIERYGKAKKANSKGASSKKEAKRIGLFWGGKTSEESVERDALSEKLKDWKQAGYNVSELETIISMDMPKAKAAFEQFEEDVSTLEEMGSELDFLKMPGFEKEVKSIRKKLKDPGQIPDIRTEIDKLQSKKEEKAQTDENLCPKCGSFLREDGTCPRCSEEPEKKETSQEREKDLDLKDGHCYLLIEEKLEKSLNLFVDMLNKGYKGFLISRTNPRYLKTREGIQNATIMWLTDKESTTEMTIQPSLERIIYEIGNFVKTEEQGCLILDGIEYLVSNNSFDGVLRFIRRIVDEVSESNNIFLFTIGPYTLKEQELKILEREMEKISFVDS